MAIDTKLKNWCIRIKAWSTIYTWSRTRLENVQSKNAKAIFTFMKTSKKLKRVNKSLKYFVGF